MDSGHHEREPPAVQASNETGTSDRERAAWRRYAEGDVRVRQASGGIEARTIMKKLRYLVRISKDPDSDWGASVPDLPGCVATGKTIDSALRRIQGAIQLHLSGMRADGVHPPRPRQRTVVPSKTSRQIDFYATVEVAA